MSAGAAADCPIEELVQRKQLMQRTATIEKVKKLKEAEKWPLPQLANDWCAKNSGENGQRWRRHRPLHRGSRGPGGGLEEIRVRRPERLDTGTIQTIPSVPPGSVGSHCIAAQIVHN